MFDDPELAFKLDSLSDQELNALPFGVVKLDRELRVRFFSETEARLSGFGVRPVLDLSFFDEVAPCMATSGPRAAAERALADGTLDLELGHTGDFSDPKRLLRCRIVSAADRGLWFAIAR